MHNFLLWLRPYSNQSTLTHIIFYLTHHLQYCQPFSFHRHLSIPANIFHCHTTSQKSSLDKEYLTNYRPFSNLSTISKLTERVVKTRFLNHLSSNSLLNPYQSAYSKNHSTETTLLSLHDHLSNAIAHQQVSCQCHLDLSAAFDTLDPSILLTRMSTWFGISSISLSWFRSYLLTCSSSVSIGRTPSNITIACGVPQGSILGPILFNLYTTPLSTLKANTSLSHHLYADDTQLFTSFVSKYFPFVINQLQSSVSTISSWMTANLLTLNTSKTEFMLIGLPQQLSKIHSPSLSLPPAQPILPCSSSRNLGFIFDPFSLSCSQQISKLSSSCHYHIRDLRRIRNFLDHKTAATITTSLVRSRLDYCNSLYYSLSASQLHRLQLIQNALARAVFRTLLQSPISPILHSLHWLKIEQRIQYKIIFITPQPITQCYTLLPLSSPQYSIHSSYTLLKLSLSGSS